MTTSSLKQLGLTAIGGAVLMLSVGSSRADTEPGTLVGRFGLVSAVRNNFGALGEAYGTGLLLGLHAGLDQGLGDSPWSVGLGWTTLVRGYYFASYGALVDQTVDVTEVNVGIRIRRAIGLQGRYAVGTLGGLLSASNVPIPPVNERRYLGFYLGAGYEMLVIGKWSLGGEARFANFPRGPKNLSGYLSFTTGI